MLNTGDKALATNRMVADNHLADLQPLLDAGSWESTGRPRRSAASAANISSGANGPKLMIST